MKKELRLDPDFTPAYLFIKKFLEDVELSGKGTPFTIALERNNNYVYHYETRIFLDGVNDDYNLKYVERLVKSLLWVVGGYKIYLLGSKYIYDNIKKIFSRGGKRDFDVKFMEKLYESKFEVINATIETLPKVKESSMHVGKNLDGYRIGFDAGGSDLKVSAVVDGNPIYSEEIVWNPKLNDDPIYHYEYILKAMTAAKDKMPRVDAIGISSAGCYVDNKIMAASLFIKVNEKDFDKYVKNMYIDIVKNHFNNIPLEVANDGDVTALAGAMNLNDTKVLGIAMGTSEAVGYIDETGNIKGWLNELAFVPVDFNEDAIIDEWSGDYGCGCKYFSQDSVIKLAERANIDLSSANTPAEKLKIVQKLDNENNPIAKEIYETIGNYLAYSLAYYSMFYEIKHVLLLGRVMTGKGGDLIIETAKKIIDAELPHLSNINLATFDESSKRVGQSIAAASLPKIN